MKTDFIRHYTKKFKEYNKKNKDKIDDKYLETSTWDKVIETVDVLAIIDTLVEDKMLHLHLLSFIDVYAGIANRRKLKDNHFKYFMDDTEYLLNWYTLHEEELKEFDDDLKVYTKEGSFYKEPAFAKICIDKYLNLLISKTVDYIPNSEQNAKKLDKVVKLFDNFKTHLYNLAENGFCFWVQVFTENNYYTPISLRYLNEFNNLGDKIEEWVDKNADNKLTKMFNDKGYDVFAGWGNLSGMLAIEGGKLKEFEKAIQKELKAKPPIPAGYVNNCIDMYYACTKMHARVPKFDVKLKAHRSIFSRYLAVCNMEYTDDFDISDKINRLIMKETETVLRKDKKFRRRPDSKLWMDPAFIPGVKHYVKALTENYYEYSLASIMLHCFDVATLDDVSFNKALYNHYKVVMTRFNLMYHGKEEANPDGLKLMVSSFNTYYKPMYQTLLDPSRMWVLEDSFAMFSNIRDLTKVEKLYRLITNWYGSRHNSNDNELQTNSFSQRLMFLSNSNKELLLEKLKDTDESFIHNYGGSVNCYHRLVTELTRYVNEPVLDGRYIPVENDDGKYLKVEA